MRDSQNVIDSLFRLFIHRTDAYAFQTSDGYVKVKEPLTPKDVWYHLDSTFTVGTYQLATDNTVKTLCLDIDLHEGVDTAKLVNAVIGECLKGNRFYESNLVLEASRYPDRSFHIWGFFDPPIKAKYARWMGNQILKHTNIKPSLVEVFPKQDQLTKTTPFGNLIKLPLGLHQKHKKWSHILDLSSIQPLDPSTLETKRGIQLEKLPKLPREKRIQTPVSPIPLLSLNDKSEQRIAQLLAKYWQQPHRNELEMYFLGWSLKRGIPCESAFRIVDAITDLTNDEEKDKRLELVKYHYNSRGAMLPQLKGITGLRKIFRQFKETEKR